MVWLVFCLILCSIQPACAFTLAVGSVATGTRPGYVEVSSPAATPMNASGLYDPVPAAQTIAAGDTVTANACGGLKRITSAGAVTTDTTNTFTAPSSANVGCRMHICNTGSNNITLDTNANFKSIGGADIVLTADDCTSVESDGTLWRSIGSLVAN